MSVEIVTREYRCIHPIFLLHKKLRHLARPSCEQYLGWTPATPKKGGDRRNEAPLLTGAAPDPETSPGGCGTAPWSCVGGRTVGDRPESDSYTSCPTNRRASKESSMTHILLFIITNHGRHGHVTTIIVIYSQIEASVEKTVRPDRLKFVTMSL